MPHSLDNDSSRSIGLLFARFPMGMYFFFAGLGKIQNGVGNFVHFAAPHLPPQMPPILGDTYLHMVPFLEILVGLSLAFGFFSRIAAFVATLMVISFTIAITGIKDPKMANITPNVIYIGLTALLFFAGSGRISLDNWIWGSHAAGGGHSAGGGKGKVIFPRPIALALLLAIAGAASGCASTVTPPPPTEQSVEVYIADYGRHSSLLLPQSDGGLIEYAYGDWDWFAASHNQWHDALHALFLSESATLGRRRIDVPPQSDLFHKQTGIEHLVPLNVPLDKEQALTADLEARFSSHVGSIVYNSDAGMCFVRDNEHYWALNNCNNATAAWLTALGCKVDGLSVWSKFYVAPPATEPTTAPHAGETPDEDLRIRSSTEPERQRREEYSVLILII